jgi:type IV pilus assembly protein PilP
MKNLSGGYVKALQIVVSLLLTGLAACSQPTDDLQRFVDEEREKVKGRVDPLPEVKPYKEYTYDPSGLRDPFDSTIFDPVPEKQKVADNGIRPDETRPREELEKYELDSLRMVGILEQNGATWALVKAPDGTVHRVTAKNYMGRNHGQIVVISENLIELKEIVPDAVSGYVERQSTVALSE